MLSNIIMGFTTALSPANLIAVLGGDHTWYLLWGDARSVGYNGDCGTNTGFLRNGAGDGVNSAGRCLCWRYIWRIHISYFG